MALPAPVEPTTRTGKAVLASTTDSAFIAFASMHSVQQCNRLFALS